MVFHAHKGAFAETAMVMNHSRCLNRAGRDIMRLGLGRSFS